MVASDKFTIQDDQGAKPKTGAGTKAPQATSAYDEYPYEMENAEDGSSTYPHNSPNEAHHEPQVQNPGAGQHANKSWPQKMPNSPRPPETSDTTRHGRSKYSGVSWPRTEWAANESEMLEERTAIDRTERALKDELEKVAERRRSWSIAAASRKGAWPAIEENESGELDQEPEATVEEIMQRGKARAQIAAERALADGHASSSADRGPRCPPFV